MVRILEVKEPKKGGGLLVIVDGQWGDVAEPNPVNLPPACARCLGQPTKYIQVGWDSEGWDDKRGNVYRRVDLPVPYCEDCYKSDSTARRREAASMLVLGLVGIGGGVLVFLLGGWWQVLGGFVVVAGGYWTWGCIRSLTHPLWTGSALFVSFFDSSRVRLGFANAEYGRLFVKANTSDEAT